MALRLKRVPVGPIVVNGPVVCTGAVHSISPSIDGNHILKAFGNCIAVFKRRHF